MQLVAYGAQDIYLTGNPQITFFKVVYRRHTNFATESIEQTFNGTAGFGKKVSCTISRNGDLITDVFLEIVMTKTAAAKSWWPAEALIKEVELEIGGQRIDKHNATWFRIYDELFRKDDERASYARMVDFTPEEQAATGTVKKRFYLPLIFFFNRNPGLALPLIALQYHEVKLNLTFEDTTIMADAGIKVDEGIDVKLFVDYIYLDTDERRRFAQVSHEYLITQVQHTGDETSAVSATNNSTQNLRLNFNHPCKYLAWVFANPAKHGHFAGNATSRNVTSEVLAPLLKAKLQLNGHDRSSERHGAYYNYTQPYQYLRALPRAGVYLYSFALKPDEHQPSGTCNFSRIDNATLVLTYKKATANASAAANVLVAASTFDDGAAGENNDLKALRVYAENYNVLRIMSGMGGLAYSN